MASLRKAIAAKLYGLEENPIPSPSGKGVLAYAKELGWKVMAIEVNGKMTAVDPSRQVEIDSAAFIEGADLCKMMDSARIEADKFAKSQSKKAANKR